MPARVFVYLTAEKKNKNFWTEWEQLKDAVYHDEIMKQYADRQLTELRNSTIEKPVPPQLTSSFLKQSDRFVFYDTPKELKDKPKFYICDDDRLYWWGGSEEVRISEETDSWLKGLAERHQKIIEQMADEPADHTAFLKEILKLMDEINSTYGRIMLFQNLFYELVMHLNEKKYRALVLLLKELAEENREEGAAIEFLRGSWDINSRAITHNIGRIRLKRYISMIANEKLRKVYFGF
jgi:hypothetical protein